MGLTYTVDSVYSVHCTCRVNNEEEGKKYTCRFNNEEEGKKYTCRVTMNEEEGKKCTCRVNNEEEGKNCPPDPRRDIYHLIQ